LEDESVPDLPAANDSELLRRVTLDFTGRIPTYDKAAEFLASDYLHKRGKLIDDLLSRESYGLHFAAICGS